MFNLNKPLIEENKAFNSFLVNYLNDEKIRVTRTLVSLGGVLFFAFYFVDLLSIPDNFITTIAIRIFGIICFIITYYWTTKRKSFLKYYNIILGSMIIIICNTIILMVYVTGENSVAFNTYFAGLMLVLSALFNFTYINTKYCLLVAALIIVEYGCILLYITSDKSVLSIILTANNVLFLLGTITLGLISDFVRKKQLYFLFQTQHQLKLSVLGSVNEISDKIITNDKLVFSIINDLKKSYFSQLNVYFLKVSIVGNNQNVLHKAISKNMEENSYSFKQSYNEILVSYFFENEDIDLIKQIHSQIIKSFPVTSDYAFYINEIHSVENEDIVLKKLKIRSNDFKTAEIININ